MQTPLSHPPASSSLPTFPNPRSPGSRQTQMRDPTTLSNGKSVAPLPPSSLASTPATSTQTASPASSRVPNTASSRRSSRPAAMPLSPSLRLSGATPACTCVWSRSTGWSCAGRRWRRRCMAYWISGKRMGSGSVSSLCWIKMMGWWRREVLGWGTREDGPK